MKNVIINFFGGLLMGCLLVTGGLAQEKQKKAQTGFQFLSVVADARAAAMAEAMTSLRTGSSAMFFNPAGMADMPGVIDGTASINKWIADINHHAFSLAVSPAGGNYGVFGLSVQTVDYGEFYGTRLIGDDFEETGTFELNAYAIGLGYARQLTDRFSVGGQIRWVHQDLGESATATNIRPDPTDSAGVRRIADTKMVDNKMSPLVFDFGTQFWTGIKSLVFGMSVRNFSKEVKYAEEGFQAPLVFNLGISMNVMDLMKAESPNQSLFMSIDATHFRDHPEQIKIGFEYQFMKTFTLRGGYVANNDEDGFSCGAGLSRSGFAFDYAYTPFGVFDPVQRMTARFSL